MLSFYLAILRDEKAFMKNPFSYLVDRDNQFNVSFDCKHRGNEKMGLSGDDGKENN